MFYNGFRFIPLRKIIKKLKGFDIIYRCGEVMTKFN